MTLGATSTAIRIDEGSPENWKTWLPPTLQRIRQVATKGSKSRSLASSAKKAWRKTVIPVFAMLFDSHPYALNDVMIQMEPTTIVRTMTRPRISV